MAGFPVGACALCSDMRELRNSHFLPKALYRLLRATGRRNPHPVRATTQERRQTAFQAAAHLLCAECEQRFDRNGENYVLKNCYRGKGVFRLREAVESLAPVHSSSEFSFYSLSGAPIDIGKISYFCASVFWRASVQDWRVEDHEYESISLGKKYGEEIRQYLLGNVSFPHNAVLSVVLSKLKFPALVFTFPDSIRTEDGWCHRLHIPGITFMLTIGKHSAESRSLCFFRSPAHPIAISTHGDARIQRDVLKLMGKVAPRWGEYPLIEGFESQQQ